MSDNPSTAAGEVPYQPTAVAPPPAADNSGGGLLAVIERLATNAQLNIDTFKELLRARREEEDREAERAFNAAISLAKAQLAPVLKTRDVDFQSSKPGSARTKYKYENLADVARVVDPVFSQHGLSYRFRAAQSGKTVRVTCVVSHALGHSEETPLEGEVDPGSTGMSAVQALGSALTYLQRYSLRAAIGLAAAVDDDGRAAGGQSPKITVEQANELERLFDETGRSQTMVLKLVGVDTIPDMTNDQWTRAKEVLAVAKAEQRRKNAPAGN